MNNKTDDSIEIVKKIIQAGESKSAFDIDAFYVGSSSDISDYFVIMSSANLPQMKAIANEIEQKLQDIDEKLIRHDSNFDSRWVVLDFGNVIVHIIHHDLRKFYKLEELWQTGTRIEINSNENQK